MCKDTSDKIQRFLDWLQSNGAQLRGCEIKQCDSDKGFGLFLSSDVSNGVLLTVPLDLAITPMRVLQDPFVGPKCRLLLEEEDLDDRFLTILFLMVERLRKDSLWKFYLDMLPTTFTSSLWFTKEELVQLKGTTLHRATELQKNSLFLLFHNKVKGLVEEILSVDGQSQRDVCFEDFLWANSVFWTRALNIPFPHSYVFPEYEKSGRTCSSTFSNIDMDTTPNSGITTNEGATQRDCVELEKSVLGEAERPPQGHTIWVEGLVPCIDFCNHDIKYVATWEVDCSGHATGIPYSMYLLSDGRNSIEDGKEITISYGNKGNEELLYLYGFVTEDNPDDYLMVHIPVEMLQKLPHSDSKIQLLEAQKASTKCLLPKRLLECGFFSMPESLKSNGDRCGVDKSCSYSWSGRRKMPKYTKNLVFPEDFMTALRTLAMQESELLMVSSMLEEIEESRVGTSPTDMEIRSAIWEVCGDDEALQLLVDILKIKLVDLEEGSGKEERDTEILNNVRVSETERDSLLSFLQELIKLLGLPVLQAKGEAEALCAQLNSGGYVDACITADSDAFLFGATCVIKCVHPNSKKPFECYNMSVVEAGLGLRRRHLIAISLLKENDHDLVGIQGIGLETALHFVRGLNEDQVLQRLEEAGSGQSPPPVDANNCSVALDNSPVQSQTKVSQRHCCVCGHPGSKQSHQKDVCGDCCTGPTHRGCVIKPAGFKCGCFICDMERKEKEKRKDVNWQMKVCKKISLGHNFPNPEIINLYLNNDNGHFNPTEGPQISWGAPNTEILVDYLAYHQNWDPSYIRQKMLPLLSTILLREMATNPTSLLLLYGQYGFDSVLRVKKSQGQELYVVKWRMLGSHHELTGGCRCDGKKIEEEKEEISVIDDMSHSLDESLDTRILVDNGCVFLLTDENKCLVQAAFPEQVQRFLKEKRERKQSSRRKGGGGGVQMSIKEFYRSTKMSFQRSKIQTLENNSPVAGEGSSRPVKRRLEF